MEASQKQVEAGDLAGEQHVGADAAYGFGEIRRDAIVQQCPRRLRVD
jgi:hypothetical protein